MKDIISSRPAEEIQFAAKELSKTSLHPTQSHPNLTPQEIIALYLDLDLSERKYNILRSFVNVFHNKCFPSIKELRQMKKSFLPEISVTKIFVK